MITNFRLLSVVIIFVVAISVGVAGIRLFPFSDYPMFSYTRNTLNVSSIKIHFRDGQELLAPNYIFYPLTRLHVAEMIWASQKKQNPDYSWVTGFKDRILRHYPSADKVIVFSGRFDEATSKPLVLNPGSIKILAEYDL